MYREQIEDLVKDFFREFFFGNKVKFVCRMMEPKRFKKDKDGFDTKEAIEFGECGATYSVTELERAVRHQQSHGKMQIDWRD